jgi:hypothetical protein
MATHIASSCIAEDVQDKISSCSDGDTLLIPAGSATWITHTANAPTVSCSKGIWICGAGTQSTFIYDSTNGGSLEEPLLVITKNGYTTKVSDITWDGANSGASSMGIIRCQGTYNQGNFYIYHNKFQNLKIRGITAWIVYGCIASNTFEAPLDETVQAISVMGDTGNGSVAWGYSLTLGTSKAVYVEDNLFDFDYMNDGCLDAYRGARYVFRYNTVNNTPIGHHGCDSGSLRGTHTWEIYNNTFTTATNTGGRGFLSRGGTGVIYNNTFTDVGGVFFQTLQLTNYRSCDTYATWGKCDGLNAYDGNDDATGYHCQDQNGWTSSGTDEGDGPNQISAPIYAWDNLLNAASVDLSVTPTSSAVAPTCSIVGVHIQENRDYFNTSSGLSYTAYTYPHPLRGQITDVTQRFVFALL